MKNKLLGLIILLALVIQISFSITANAETDGIYKYTITNNQATITRCSTSASGSITIPATLGGYPVKSIGDKAFSGCSSITSVTIPVSVTSIGNSAFYYCTNLTSVTIPNSVTSIDSWAFANCYSLTSITIPNSITSITYGAFLYCTNLTSITIPDSVSNITYDAFAGCSGLTAINVDINNLNYSSIDGVLFNKNQTVILAYPNAKGSTYTIPNSVTSIGQSAFSNCTSLTSITIPNSVTSIGWDAFSNCISLTSITIPNNVTSIDNYAFYGCESLTNITIPNSVKSIGELSFGKCRSLTNITIPNNVTFIGQSAFAGCSGLTAINVDINNLNYSSIDGVLFNKNQTVIVIYSNAKGSTYTIPNSVTSIGQSAFSNCTSLTSITIPNSVTSIGWDAFFSCSSLTSITLPNSLTSIGSHAFYDCSSLTSITIPNSVTSIGYGAFSYCVNLTSITIPNSVTSIGEWTFSNCYNLTNITIPNSVTSIGYGAFSYCVNLTSITIPDSVTSIGDGAFDSCDNLTTIYCDVTNEYIKNYFGFSKNYINNIIVTFVTNCESNLEDINLINNSLIPTPNIINNGYILENWYKEPEFINKWDFATDTVSKSITLYAKWVKYSPYLINNLSINTDEISIDILKNEDRKFKDNIMVVSYDESGRIVQVDITEMYFKVGLKTNLTSLLTNTQYSKVKIFIWNNTSNLKPLSNIAEFNLNNRPLQSFSLLANCVE